MSKEEKSKTGLYGLAVKVGGKLLTFAPKILKFTKVLKFGLLAASLGSYAYLFTWKFAVLIIVSLYWHEHGHLWAARRMGMKTKGVFLVPLIGAVAVTDGNVKSYGAWSYVALMGPIWGLIQTVAFCIAYYITGIPLIAAAAGFVAFINVFNLFPVSPLDGGGVVRSIAFSIHKNLGFVFMVLSLVASTILMFKMRAGLFAFLIILGGVDLIVEYYRRRAMTKHRNECLAKADEYYERFMELDAKDMADEIKKRWTRCANDAISSMPTAMSGRQIAYSVCAYALTTIALIAIIKLMATIPGADLANTFLAS